MEERHIPVCKGGGIFHSHKIQYSKETQEFVRKLLNESKLSIVQRTLLQNIVKNGKPLPKPIPSIGVQKLITTDVKQTSNRKRSKNAIEQSGAYNREKFVPVRNKVSYDKEKERFQSLMAYGKDIQIGPNPGSGQSTVNQNEFGKCTRLPRRVPKEPTKDEMFEDLLLEIEERAQFLEDMEMLGEEKKYKEIIENEISSKMRQMEMLDKERYNKQTGIVETFRRKYKSLSEVKTLSMDAS